MRRQADTQKQFCQSTQSESAGPGPVTEESISKGDCTKIISKFSYRQGFLAQGGNLALS